VARLIAKAPLEAVLPVVVESARLIEVEPGRMTSVAPFAGKDKAVASVLRKLGLRFPAPGAGSSRGPARLIWTGRGQAMLLGVEPPEALVGIAALTDQSDGWSAMRLDGPLAEAVLARVVPVDLRVPVFPEGAVARTMLFHMTCTITRVGAEAFEILVLRSFGRTAVQDLATAMRSVAAQA
jgi:sarcosine oxidase subunit gamma